MSDDSRGRGPIRVVLAALGLITGAAATMVVIEAGGPAVTTDGSAPRTVVATVGPARPGPSAAEVTVTVDPAAVSETPVRLPGTAGRPTIDLRQIVYTVAGNQRPDDPVTVVYADETGTLQTLQNVTLPWSMTVTPELPVNYVTANSRGSQLNCWITVSGTTVVSDTEFRPSTTCNR
ncbi:MAG: hypothetical protein KDB71_05565 [Mycobacterium sp.]|nr:hypothetical protein [Mycobacterium sp.]